MNEYEIEYWILIGSPDDSYDIRYLTVNADTAEEALNIGKEFAPDRAKDFSIV